MLTKILEIYARKGISLSHIGIQEAALPIKDVDEALDCFVSLKWIVLGGDIYKKYNENWENTYLSWFCSNDKNGLLSVREAKSYLSSLNEENYFVVFVLQAENT